MLSEELGLPVQFTWRAALPELSQREMFMIAGNSNHSELASELTLWALASVMSREHLFPSSLMRPSSVWELDLESDSEDVL